MTIPTGKKRAQHTFNEDTFLLLEKLLLAEKRKGHVITASQYIEQLIRADYKIKSTFDTI